MTSILRRALVGAGLFLLLPGAALANPVGVDPLPLAYGWIAPLVMALLLLIGGGRAYVWHKIGIGWGSWLVLTLVACFLPLLGSLIILTIVSYWGLVSGAQMLRWCTEKGYADPRNPGTGRFRLLLSGLLVIGFTGLLMVSGLFLADLFFNFF